MQEAKVLIIYCKCGKSFETVGDPAYFKNKEIAEAIKNGQKVETVPFQEYKAMTTPFLCKDVEGCPKNV